MQLMKDFKHIWYILSLGGGGGGTRRKDLNILGESEKKMEIFKFSPIPLLS